jgi:apolipoprotein N-acyltransferase
MKSIALLSIGAALLLMSNGQIIAPLATVLCAPFLLLSIERQSPVVGASTLAVVFVLASSVMWSGIIPAPGMYYYLVATIYGLAHWAPYFVHRLVSGLSGGLVATLAFPSAYVLVEAALNAATPYGSWSSIAYGFSSSSAVAQLSALGGLPLVTFAVAWCGSVLAWGWRNRRHVKSSFVFSALALAAPIM